jgi:hypothetical protein
MTQQQAIQRLEALAASVAREWRAADQCGDAFAVRLWDARLGAILADIERIEASARCYSV